MPKTASLCSRGLEILTKATARCRWYLDISLRGDGRARAGGRWLRPLAVAVCPHRGLDGGQLSVQHVERRLPALVPSQPLLPKVLRLQINRQR